MIERKDQEAAPSLREFPSARAQPKPFISGNATPTRRRRRGVFHWLARLVIAVVVVAVVGAGVLLAMLTQGPVSSEQLRAQVENQLSLLLGKGHTAAIGEAKLAIGANGLLSLDANNVRILRDQTVNLGVANAVGVKLKAMPLLSGQVKVESVDMRGAAIALSPFLPAQPFDRNAPWPEVIDFSQGFVALREALGELEMAMDRAGLEKLALNNARLIGFDQLGLRSPTATIAEMVVEKDVNFQKGLFIKAQIITRFRDWTLRGEWKPQGPQGAKVLTLALNGMDLSDFWSTTAEAGPESEFGGSGRFSIALSAPYAADGTPGEPVMQVTGQEWAFVSENRPLVSLRKGEFNLRLLPKKNQIELEDSPVEFETTQAVLIGGLRYPANESEIGIRPRQFQIAANEMLAYGDIGNAGRLKAAAGITGKIDISTKTVRANTIQLLTPNGRIEGTGFMSFAALKPHVGFDLAIPTMPVDEFKQFWPAQLAPKSRQWAREGIRDGTINKAWVKADFPPGLLGRGEAYEAENLRAEVPVTGASVRTVGSLPRIVQATGQVDYEGRKAIVRLESGTVNLGPKGIVRVARSKLDLGEFTDQEGLAKLDLDLSGPASALAQIGTLKPFSFTNKLKLEPAGLSGKANASVQAAFSLEKVAREGVRDWDAQVKLSNVSSKAPVAGRKLANADMNITASPKGASVKGTAKVDGVPAKLALSGDLNDTANLSSTVTLKLTDKQRRNLGIDTGEVLRGPISVVLTQTPDGNRIEADLKQARLSFPWIGWSKGKGIPAKATLVQSSSKGVTRIRDLRVKGSGFSMAGDLVLDKNGLRQANMKRLRLNESDDLSVTVDRTKDGYAVKFNARRYDGRALIRSVMKSGDPGSSGAQTITVSGKLGRLDGFNGQRLTNVSVDFRQRGAAIQRAVMRSGRTLFALQQEAGGMNLKLTTGNAGLVLRFLDLYTKMRGGSIEADLTRDRSSTFRGRVVANNFTLLNEPRLATLLAKPRSTARTRDGDSVAVSLPAVRSDNVKVDEAVADIEKGTGFLRIARGRIAGGDASAAFEGTVYDRNNRMNITGTYLPGRGLNRVVSKIPILGLAFGKGKVNGLLGVTFRLAGRYGNPQLQVNPLSIIAPGVFRNIFKF
ncbi:MAG: DUF3971 domain-containing protein [Pseudomonadota bacterium]